MRVHYLQHVPFEGIGAIGEWARDRAHALSGTEMFRLPEAGSPEVPQPDDLDLLVIMGGPMNVHQDSRYPWLRVEKDVIASAIAADKLVLGCMPGSTTGGGRARRRRHEGNAPGDRLVSGGSQGGRAGGPGVCRVPCTFRGPPLARRHVQHPSWRRPRRIFGGLRQSGLRLQRWSSHRAAVPPGGDPRVAGVADRERSGRLDRPGRPDAERWISTPAELLSPAAPFAPCRDLLFRLLDSMVMAPD